MTKQGKTTQCEEAVKAGKKAGHTAGKGWSFGDKTYIVSRSTANTYLAGMDEVHFKKETRRLMRFLGDRFCCTDKTTAIALIQTLAWHRPGEDYGGGDGCYNTDCSRDYPEKYHTEMDGHLWCPECMPDNDTDTESV